jgi:hypothetical protein
VGVEILDCVSEATERGAGRRSIRRPCAGGLRPAQYDRYEGIPRLLPTRTDVGWIHRVVDMSELIEEKHVGSYGATPRGWTDKYLNHGGLADLIWRQRSTHDALVVLAKERLGLRHGQAEQCGNSGGCRNHDRHA